MIPSAFGTIHFNDVGIVQHQVVRVLGGKWHSLRIKIRMVIASLGAMRHALLHGYWLLAVAFLVFLAFLEFLELIPY